MQAFACPQCGASLDSEAIYGATAECPYCHSAVIVPPELRPAPPPPPPPPVFNSYQPEPSHKQAFSFQRAIAISVVSVFFFVLFMVFLVGSNKTKESSSYTSTSTRPAMSSQATPTPYVFTFGAEGTGPGLFKDAKDVAADGAGNIYVSDDTLRVQKFDSQGVFLTQWSIPSSTQYVSKIRGGPDRILADRDGSVYVVIGGVVLKFNGANGASLGTAYGADYVFDAALKADGGLVIVTGNSENDDMIVLDSKSKAIKRVDKFISSQLENQIPVEAVKVAVDGVGNIFGIYAIGSIYGEHSYDNEDLAVFRFNADGKYINRFGGGGNADGQFQLPNAIAVDGHSRIYVCDLTTGIHVFTDDGRYLKTLKAPFWVQGMAFDTAGDLLIVGDNKVSKLTLSK